MCERWKKCSGRRVIPLPTQDCACHRIAFCDAPLPGREDVSRSVFITELASSKLLQIKTHNLCDMQRLDETVSMGADGFEVHNYTPAADIAGSAC